MGWDMNLGVVLPRYTGWARILPGLRRETVVSQFGTSHLVAVLVLAAAAGLAGGKA